MHRNLKRSLDRARYLADVAAGLCSACHKAQAEPNRRRCAACAKVASAWALAKAKRIRAAQDALGICPRCNQRAAMPGLHTCAVCAEAKAEYNTARARRHREAGICVDCTEPAMPGRARCARHLEENRILCREAYRRRAARRTAA